MQDADHQPWREAPSTVPEIGRKTLPRLAGARAASLLLLLVPLVDAVGAAGPASPARAALPPPLTVDQLGRREFVTRLQRERTLRGGPGYSAYLVSYRSAGLLLRALVAVPASPPPPAGYPVLVACHGTHPDPPRYGYTSAGVDDRPGDYYRSVPEAYTNQGFLVLMPDYRGHNDSDGGQFAHGSLAPAYYAEDVRDLLAALPTLPQADAGNVFLWGHSLGGEVALRVLLALDGVRGVQVRAASLWSTVGGQVWEQAYYYGRRAAPQAEVGGAVGNPGSDALRRDLAALDGPYDWRAGDPLSFLERLRTPLLLQHGLDDRSAPFEWSERLAAALERLRLPYRLMPYRTAEHFFDEPGRRDAVAHDVEFFRAYLGAWVSR